MSKKSLNAKETLVGLYAQFIYSIFKFTISIKGIYKRRKASEYRALGEATVLREANVIALLSKFMDKIFEAMTSPSLLKEAKYEYTLSTYYNGCKFLIRPFVLSEIVMACGLWELELKDLLYKEVRKTDVIVNVGAYIGIYAIPLAKKSKKVIAFEPHPLTFKVLQKNMELNNLKNITIINKAVGETKKRVHYSLSYDPKLSGISLTENIERPYRSIEVETIDLDSTLDGEDSIDWLLIDAEGYELNVLKGAKNILRERSPKIIIEIARNNFDKVSKELINESYMIEQIYDIVFYCTKQSM